MKSNEKHVDSLPQSKNNNKIVKTTSNISAVSNSFEKLRDNNKITRINAAINLIQQLKDLQSDENQVRFQYRKSIFCVTFSKL